MSLILGLNRNTEVKVNFWSMVSSCALANGICILTLTKIINDYTVKFLI